MQVRGILKNANRVAIPAGGFSLWVREARLFKYGFGIALYHDLVGARPLHASPAEHQATPDVWYPVKNGYDSKWEEPNLHGNFRGWNQNRKLIEREIYAVAA